MACLKLSVGCLAVVGLVVVVTVVLLVGSCVGVFAWGAAHGFGVPERASRVRLETDHRVLLAEIQRHLGSSEQGDWRAPAGLVALREHDPAAGDKDRDLLSGSVPAWNSHTLINGAGIGTVDGRSCLIYVVHSATREVWVYIADPGATTPESSKPK